MYPVQVCQSVPTWRHVATVLDRPSDIDFDIANMHFPEDF